MVTKGLDLPPRCANNAGRCVRTVPKLDQKDYDATLPKPVGAIGKTPGTTGSMGADMPRALKYQIPTFLGALITQERYERWLRGRTAAHIRRDRKRGNKAASGEVYRVAMHTAVVMSEGVDHYTGELLDWALLGKYSNAESKAQRRKYKATFALLPSIDHVGDGLGEANFKVCAWRTNDAKNDLSHDDFVALCRRVVTHHEKAAGVSATCAVEPVLPSQEPVY